MARVAGGAGRRILVVLAVLAVLVIGVDRVGLLIAERAAANTIQSSQHLRERPDVSIGGFPFLNQLATGRYDEITVTARNVPVDARVHLLTVTRVQVELRHLTVARNFGSFRARDATAIARITYAELSKTLGLQVSYAGNGRIKAARTFSFAGTSVMLSISTRPVVVNSALGFAGTAIDNAGQVGVEVSSVLDSVFNFAISFADIPFGIKVRSLSADQGGITVTLVGHNLYYAR